MNIVKSQDIKRTHKLLAFPYNNKEKSEIHVKKTVPYITVTERIKYPGINLRKRTTDLYAENYKALVKETKMTQTDRETPCFWVGRINIVKMTILSKAISRFSAIPIKLPMAFF